MSIEQAETIYPKFRELPLPDTFPKDGSCAADELMRVVEVLQGNARVGYHIELQEQSDWPDGWQLYWGDILAQIAWKIREYVEDGEDKLESFDQICAAFIRTARQLKQKELKRTPSGLMDRIEEVTAAYESGGGTAQ
jgi:hypothetical protein